MATRIQLRRGTATQWTTADPILEAGEIGWESNTNKFKIGDGINNWEDLTYFLDSTDTGFNAGDYILATSKNAVSGVAALDANINVVTTTGVVFEGATANEHELTLAIAADPTSDRTITLPDATGTVQLRVADVSDEEIAHLNGVTSGIQTQLDGKVDESLFDAKGDLLVGSADNTPAKLAVGTNGYILTANSSATNGIEWAAAPAGYSPPTLGSTQIGSGSTVTTIAGLTLSTPTVSGLTVSDGSIVIEGATANEFETTLQFTDPTADRTITFQDVTGTVAYLSDISAATGGSVTETAVQTLTNKTLTSPKINEDVAVTATATEINLIDGSTAGTIANGKAVIYGAAGQVNATTLQIAGTSITATAAELNYVDGVTSAIQTQIDSKLNLTDPALDYYITNSGSGAYIVNGVSNGTIYFEKGKKYRIHINASGHPFWIQTSSGAYNSGNVYSTGITNNGAETGHIIVELAQNAPQLYYACQYHSSMAGSINIGSSASNLTITGDLTVNGTTTTINSTTLTVDDINITLGQGNTSDAVADGGGITLEGATNKTFNWVDATDAWTSSEHMNLLTGKSYKINNTAISAALPALTWGEVKNGKSGLTIS